MAYESEDEKSSYTSKMIGQNDPNVIIPLSAATCNGVRPFIFIGLLISAPFATSISTIAKSPARKNRNCHSSRGLL